MHYNKIVRCFSTEMQGAIRKVPEEAGADQFISLVWFWDYLLLIVPVFILHLLSIFLWKVFAIFSDRFVCRTDNFTVIGQLLQSVCAPSGNTCDGKDRCIEL